MKDLILTAEEAAVLAKGLESKFKKSENPIITKLKDNSALSKEDATLVSKKLEYRFKKSGNPVVEKLNSYVNS